MDRVREKGRDKIKQNHMRKIQRRIPFQHAIAFSPNNSPNTQTGTLKSSTTA